MEDSQASQKSASDSASKKFSLFGRASDPTDVLATRGLAVLYVNDIPTWQHHWWSRERRDVPTRLPSPLVPNVEPVAPKVEEHESDSDSSSSSDSEDDFDDPLAARGGSESVKKSRFPVDTKLNEKISLWYVSHCLSFHCFVFLSSCCMMAGRIFHSHLFEGHKERH